ncbi:hypothetical protein D3C87_1988640 [compost metagenome]
MLLQNLFEITDLRKCLAPYAVELPRRVMDRLPDIRKAGDAAEEAMELVVDLESLIDVTPLCRFLLAKDK